MKKYLDWAQRKQSSKQQVITMCLAGVFFLILLPFLLLRGADALDHSLLLPRFYGGIINIIIGIVVSLAGFLLGGWSVYAELTIGEGTPLPFLPTQKLVVKPPFTYCRNPMTLGTIIAYSGIGIWIGSFSAIGVVLLFGALLLSYVKFFEERELEARFGSDYVEYKRKTPFLLPRLRKRL